MRAVWVDRESWDGRLPGGVVYAVMGGGDHSIQTKGNSLRRSGTCDFKSVAQFVCAWGQESSLHN